MMEIHVYCPGNGEYRPTSRGDPPFRLSLGDVHVAGKHQLIKLVAQPPDLEQIIQEEIGRFQRGKRLVSGTVIQHIVGNFNS